MADMKLWQVEFDFDTASSTKYLVGATSMTAALDEALVIDPQALVRVSVYIHQGPELNNWPALEAEVVAESRAVGVVSSSLS